MNTRGVSPDQVSAAAERLTARGERVTVRGVRAELGETGSLATIARHLAGWRDSQRPLQATSLSLPAELQRLILAEIERNVAAARAELDAELADARADRDAITEEAERLAQELAGAQQRIAEQGAELERQSGVVSQLERQLTEAREQLAREREAAEGARKAAALAELRLESLPQLHAEVETLRGKLDAEREARRVAEIEAAELRGQQGTKGA